MKIKNKFIIYCIIIHITLIFFTVQLLKIESYLFFIGEILIIISIVFSIWVYFGLSKPFDLIASGIESIKDKEFDTRLVKVGHPEIDDLIMIYNQMIDQLREERIKQTESNNFLSKLVQSSPSGIIMLDPKGQIISVNPAATQILRKNSKFTYEMNLNDLQGELGNQLRNLKNGISQIININANVYKCQKAHFVNRGFSHYFIMIEELTNEIYEKQKYVYEKVIRIMSHETNNSIGAINSILDSIMIYKNQLNYEYRDGYQNALIVAINRNIALSNIMSNFAKVVMIPDPVKETANLHEFLKTVQILMNPLGKKKQVQWKWDLSNEEIFVNIDVQQMEQVMINILKNSIEAVEQKGQIIIRTSTNPLSVSVLDNGCGLTKEVNQQLFSPFFTTKRNGQGVGLTVIREILNKHNFAFSLNNYNGLTEFNFFLDEHSL